MTAASPKGRRWFRVSLRTLLVLITAFGVWLGFQVAAARKQRNALQSLQASGGWSFDFGYQCTPLPSTSFRFSVDRLASPPGPEWLRNLAGEDFFRTVYIAKWNDRARVRIPESALDSLASLTELRQLIMRPIIQVNGKGTRRFNDSDLAKLSGLRKLEVLDLSGVDIHEPGLRSLSKLKNLKWLQLDFTDYTNSRRDNEPTLLDDVAMQHLGELTSLEELRLECARLAKDGIEHLAKLKQLVSLELLDCEGLDEAGLEHLAELPKLKSLRLSRSDVGDSGLAYLEPLTHLKELYVERSKATRDGLVKLRNALPLSVDYDPPAGTSP